MKYISKLLPVIIALTLSACSKPSPDSPDTPPDPPPTSTYYLKASVNELTVSGNADKLDSFLIESNTKWKISITTNSTDWVTITPLSGTGNGKVYVSSKQNNYPAVARTATAHIYAENLTLPTVRISLTQGSYEASDPPNLLWNQLYGGTGNDRGLYAAKAPDGGLIVVGNTNSNNGDIPANSGGKDGIILKLNAAGAKQWVRIVGGDNDEELYGVAVTPDGGYLACGLISNSNQTIYGGAYLVRLDANGNLLWEKRINTTPLKGAMAVTLAHDGGFLVTGATLGSDVWVAKIDDSGNLLWEKKYGGTYDEIGFAVVKSPGGGYVITATSESNNGDVVGAHGKRDAWVLKINNAGTMEWKKTFGGSGDDEIWDIKAVSDGYVLAGFTTSNDGDVSGKQGFGPNAWLVKLDGSGNLLWQKCVAMANGASVAVSPNGQHYFLAGASGVAQVDNQGNIVAQQTFGDVINGNAMLYTILNVSATEYIATGYTAKREGSFSSNKGGEDIWVLKFKLPL